MNQPAEIHAASAHPTNTAAGAPKRRVTGVVTFYHERNNYGFVQDAAGDGYFFHDSDVAELNGCHPVPGQPAVFLRSSNDRGLKAEQVSLLALAEAETRECPRCQMLVTPRLVLGMDNTPWCAVCPQCTGGLEWLPPSQHNEERGAGEAPSTSPSTRQLLFIILPLYPLIAVIAYSLVMMPSQ